MTAADWMAGLAVTAGVWGTALAFLIKSRRAHVRESRELRRSAERAVGPHEVGG